MDLFKQDMEGILKTLIQGQNYMKNEMLILKEEILTLKNEQTKAKKVPDVNTENQPKEQKTFDQTKKHEENKVKQETSEDPKNQEVSGDKDIKNVLYIGTSLSKSLDRKKFQKDTKTKLKVVKAYGIKKESDQFYPKLNFTDVVPKSLEKDKPDVLVLQAGSIEISNLNVKNAMMNTEKDIEEYSREWAAKVEDDSNNLFEVAENALKADPKMKVIIVKRLPRYDSSAADPLGIKANLSQFANSVYDQLWFKKGGPINIHIVNFDLGCDDSRYLKDILFGKPGEKSYDGVHLRGFAASRHFTYRAVQAIRPVIISSRPVQTANFDRTDYHADCPQTRLQRQAARQLAG